MHPYMYTHGIVSAKITELETWDFRVNLLLLIKFVIRQYCRLMEDGKHDFLFPHPFQISTKPLNCNLERVLDSRLQFYLRQLLSFYSSRNSSLILKESTDLREELCQHPAAHIPSLELHFPISLLFWHLLEKTAELRRQKPHTPQRCWARKISSAFFCLRVTLTSLQRIDGGGNVPMWPWGLDETVKNPRRSNPRKS